MFQIEMNCFYFFCYHRDNNCNIYDVWHVFILYHTLLFFPVFIWKRRILLFTGNREINLVFYPVVPCYIRHLYSSNDRLITAYAECNCIVLMAMPSCCSERSYYRTPSLACIPIKNQNSVFISGESKWQEDTRKGNEWNVQTMTYHALVYRVDHPSI